MYILDSLENLEPADRFSDAQATNELFHHHILSFTGVRPNQGVTEGAPYKNAQNDPK